jgi:pimeloyl-ACP methyl ester carboxylesterase
VHRTEELLRLPSGGALHIQTPAAPGPYPPILFVHGVGGAAWSWGPQLEALGGEFTCFTWEGRGHGASPRVQDAGLGDYYRDALEALTYVFETAGQPALVVGHSMGGLIALALACEKSAAVRGLFLIDPVYSDGNGDRHVMLPKPAIALVRLVVAPIARSYMRDGKISRTISRWIFEKAFEDRVAMERVWKLQCTQVPVEYPQMLFEAFEGVSNFPFHPFADVVTVPTYLVEAASTRGPKQARFGGLAARLRARLGEAATYDVIPGGHYLQLDRPHEINERIETFARSLERPQAATP